MTLKFLYFEHEAKRSEQPLVAKVYIVTHIAVHMLNIEGASLSEQLLRLHAHMNGLSSTLK